MDAARASAGGGGGGLGRAVVPVRWEFATDEAMRDVVASGSAEATPEWGHSVHVEPQGLAPDRPYWYRFRAGDAQSPIGRTRTAPAVDASPARLRFAFASCQQYEQGYYGAYRHIVADAPDLIVFLGDYTTSRPGAQPCAQALGRGALHAR